MGRGVDAAREAGDDVDPGARRGSRANSSADLLAVGVGAPRADDGDAPARAGQLAARRRAPAAAARAGAGRRVVGVAGDDEPRAEALGRRAARGAATAAASAAAARAGAICGAAARPAARRGARRGLAARRPGVQLLGQPVERPGATGRRGVQGDRAACAESGGRGAVRHRCGIAWRRRDRMTDQRGTTGRSLTRDRAGDCPADGPPDDPAALVY